MVNELCQLAASGINARQLAIFGTAMFMLGTALFLLHKKYSVNVTWLLPVALLVFTVGAPFQQLVLAQSAENCVPQQNNGQTPNPGMPGVLGNLIDDNPELTYDELGEGYFATFSVLPNDNAPNGDPFDITTLQLLGTHQIVDSWGWVSYLILDPNNQTMPDPDSSWWDAPNVWGYWYLDLTCDPEDVDHCNIALDDSGVCNDPLGGTCWPNGNVGVLLNSRAQPGTYSIPYTVTTQGGIPLTPATITVAIPEPSPIIAQDSEVEFDACLSDPWGSVWSLDIMPLVSTTGTGALLPSTIDLNPDTPGIQSTVTYGSIEDYNLTTYVVDGNGIVTMTAPVVDEWGERRPSFGFWYTISDDEGHVSNIAQGVEFIPEFTPSCGRD